MRLLLDTHTFLWYITQDHRLAPEVADAVRQKSNEVYLSVVSVWEALVKHQLGKLPMPSPADEYLRTRRIQHQILSLDLNEAAIDRLLSLPRHHNDPFDRMLICQAIHHDMTLATADDDIAKYPVKILSS